MAVAHRIESLKQKHAALEAALQEEESHPWLNEARVVHLKRDKLRLKDEMQKLCRSGEGRCASA